MFGIGPQLKSAREERGLDIAEVAARLHIRAIFVQAMEKEDWRRVGEPVYVRGFLRNYARLLGLDAARLLDDLEAVYPAPNRHPAPVDGSIDSLQRFDMALETPRVSNSRWYAGLFWAMSALAAVLVVAAVVNTIVLVTSPRSQGRPPAAALQANPAAQRAEPVRPADSQGQTQTGAQAQEQSAPQPQSQPAALVEANAATKQDGVVLRIELTQACWLSVSVDGKRVLYETLPAGTVREFHGTRKIAMRAGNAGGVVAIIDGRTLGTLGQQGEVQDRVFAVNGSGLDKQGQ